MCSRVCVLDDGPESGQRALLGGHIVQLHEGLLDPTTRKHCNEAAWQHSFHAPWRARRGAFRSRRRVTFSLSRSGPRTGIVVEFRVSRSRGSSFRAFSRGSWRLFHPDISSCVFARMAKSKEHSN